MAAQEKHTRPGQTKQRNVWSRIPTNTKRSRDLGWKIERTNPGI